MIWSSKKRRAEEKRLLAECERMAERLGAKAAPNGRRVDASMRGTWLDVKFDSGMQSEIYESGATRLSALTQLHERLSLECAGLPEKRNANQ